MIILNPTDIEVLELLASGLSVKETANKLHKSLVAINDRLRYMRYNNKATTYRLMYLYGVEQNSIKEK